VQENASYGCINRLYTEAYSKLQFNPTHKVRMENKFLKESGGKNDNYS